MSLLSHFSFFSIVHCILIKTLNLFTFVLNHLLRPFIHGLNNFVFAKLLENNCREKPQLWEVFENVSLCTVQYNNNPSEFLLLCCGRYLKMFLSVQYNNNPSEFFTLVLGSTQTVRK